MTLASCSADELPRFHTVAIGAGPANLSLAALFEAVAPHRIALFERQPAPAWHRDLLFPGVRMQTSWLKDLVCLVEPCHRLTFLNYLVSTGRLFALLNSQYAVIPRQEYARYLAWAGEQLEDIYYGTPVDRVSFDGGFQIHSRGRLIAHSDHLVLGIGSMPYVPATFAGLLGAEVFVPEQLGERIQALQEDPDAPIAVVGGGQTGAECVLTLLSGGLRRVLWLGRRPWFQPLDDSPNANEFYRPAYLAYLQRLSRATRRRLIEGAVLSGDAITPGTMQTIYQANYEGMLRHGAYPLTLYPARDVVSAERSGRDIVLEAVAPEGRETYRTRHVVLATGRRPAPLPLDHELLARIEVDECGEPVLNEDFSVRWESGNGHKLYARHLVRFTHGIAASNLTLLPIGSAIIINSLFDKEIFTVRDDWVSTVWG
jgi:lysine N6-hydroxylase